MKQSDDILKKVLKSGVLRLILEQWHEKYIFIASEKVLKIFVNLTTQIDKNLLEETLKTGVLGIFIKELK